MLGREQETIIRTLGPPKRNKNKEKEKRTSKQRVKHYTCVTQQFSSAMDLSPKEAPPHPKAPKTSPMKQNHPKVRKRRGSRNPWVIKFHGAISFSEMVSRKACRFALAKWRPSERCRDDISNCFAVLVWSKIVSPSFSYWICSRWSQRSSACAFVAFVGWLRQSSSQLYEWRSVWRDFSRFSRGGGWREVSRRRPNTYSLGVDFGKPLNF